MCRSSALICDLSGEVVVLAKNRNVELVKWQKGFKRLQKKENIHTLDSPQTLPVTFPAAFS